MGISMPAALRERVRGTRRLHALGDHRHLGQHVIERAALAEFHADVAVPAERARAREDQVAHAGQAGQCQRVGAELHTEPRNLGQPARDERRARIVAEAEAHGHARRDGNHVLERTAQLDAHHVRAGVAAEIRRLEQLLAASAASASWLAMVTAVGCSCATSSAKLGPDRKHARAAASVGSTSACTCAIVFSVSSRCPSTHRSRAHPRA
jgi:hypothetical protein